MNAFLISPFTAGSYSPPVTTFLGSVDTAGMRTAIGLGTADGALFNSLGITASASANIFTTSAAALQTAGYLGVSRAINLIDTAGISWSSTSTLLGATGLNLLQDGPGILAQRNGSDRQLWRLYNAYTDGVNYDRAVMQWTAGGTLQIGTENLGTSYATVRPIDFVVGGVVRMSIAATGLISTSASLIVNNTVVCGPSSNFEWNGRSTLSSSADGLIKIANYLGADFGRLQLGGTTSAFPAIKRSGASIHMVLADDSAYANLRCASLYQQPPASIDPAFNGDFIVQATSNTTLTLKLKGTDGTIRSVALTLA